MVPPRRTHARWIAVAIVLALAASALVVFALVELTSPSATEANVEPTTTAAAAPTHTATTSAGGRPAVTMTPSADPLLHRPLMPAGSSHTSSSPAPVTTATSALAGSGVTLPAAWAGTARVTIAVRGQCASSTPSVYPAVPANLALDLTQNEVNAAGSPTTEAVPADLPTLTLGVGANGQPKLAVYSSIVEQSGALVQYWTLGFRSEQARTEITGTLTQRAPDANNPNTLSDSETSLQPCESAGTVSLPRVLADGSTLSGWVSATQAHLELQATTTDGRRAVTVDFSAGRRQ